LNYSFVRNAVSLNPNYIAKKLDCETKFAGLLNSLVCASKVVASSCDKIKDQYSNFISDPVLKSKFRDFDYKSDRVDRFFSDLIGHDENYEKPFSVFKGFSSCLMDKRVLNAGSLW
jgi:hypothetical protein